MSEVAVLGVDAAARKADATKVDFFTMVRTRSPG
jgi:alpha-D-ribose 1-methylphosphonate 5-triphosphate synthase subunit PhnG